MIVLEEFPPHNPRIVWSQKWDERFLQIAQEISTWSKDPSTKVGAIAVNLERRILAQGYNGFPVKSDDSEKFYNTRKSKYARIVHAESNIIYNACNSHVGLQNSTVYVYGMYPCSECVKGLTQVQVSRIVFQLGQSSNVEKWKSDFDTAKCFLREVGIGYTHYQDEKDCQTQIGEPIPLLDEYRRIAESLRKILDSISSRKLSVM
jgi:dCMP deaminase